MSHDIYIACQKCKAALHVAQMGLGGFTFYSGQEDTMRLLGAFLNDHLLCGETYPDVVRFMKDDDVDEWLDVCDSRGELIPLDDPAGDEE